MTTSVNPPRSRVKVSFCFLNPCDFSSGTIPVPTTDENARSADSEVMTPSFQTHASPSGTSGTMEALPA
ncbi:hypothetical protein A5N75_22310 [Prescottella equi]|nr:hypothetical protein A5N75_22310 [Prescottella equi]